MRTVYVIAWEDSENGGSGFEWRKDLAAAKSFLGALNQRECAFLEMSVPDNACGWEITEIVDSKLWNESWEETKKQSLLSVQ